MKMNVTIKQLRAFVTAAQHLSFSKAASELAMTQSGFSLLVQDLEAQLNVRLFDRTTRRVTLTAVGKGMLPMAHRLLGDLENVCQHVADLREGRLGKVSVAVLPSIAAVLMPQLLTAFRARYPGIAVSIKEAHAGQLVEHVVQGTVDLGVGVRLGPTDDLAFDVLLKDFLVAVLHAQDPLADKEAPSWQEIAERPYIAIADTSSVYRLAARAFDEAGVDISPSFQVASMATAVAFVRCGLGFTLLPEMGLSMLKLDGLAVRHIHAPHVHRDIGVYRLENRHLSPAAEAFRQMLTDTLRG